MRDREKDLTLLKWTYGNNLPMALHRALFIAMRDKFSLSGYRCICENIEQYMTEHNITSEIEMDCFHKMFTMCYCEATEQPLDNDLECEIYYLYRKELKLYDFWSEADYKDITE